MLTRSLYDFSGEYFGLVDYQDGDRRGVVAKFMLKYHFVKVSVVVNLLMNKAMELCSRFMILLIFWHDFNILYNVTSKSQAMAFLSGFSFILLNFKLQPPCWFTADDYTSAYLNRCIGGNV